MEGSNGTLSNGACAFPSDLSVNVTEYPVADAGRWMQNRLDGTIHPAFNTDDFVYDSDKDNFALLADKAKLDLYERQPRH